MKWLIFSIGCLILALVLVELQARQVDAWVLILGGVAYLSVLRPLSDKLAAKIQC